MAVSGISEEVERFVVRLLASGLALTEIVREIADGLPADAYPGERPTAVALEMLCGTIAAAFEAIPPADVRRAIELMELAHDRTIGHLQLALALRRRMQSEDGPARG